MQSLQCLQQDAWVEIPPIALLFQLDIGRREKLEKNKTFKLSRAGLPSFYLPLR
jgi:hypothetical protein